VTWFSPETEPGLRWQRLAICACADPGQLAAVCGPLPPGAALTLHKTLHFSLFLTHTRPVIDPQLISSPPSVTLDNLALTHRIRGTASILQPYLIAGTDLRPGSRLPDPATTQTRPPMTHWLAPLHGS
jgi:hypothetical protein